MHFLLVLIEHQCRYESLELHYLSLERIITWWDNQASKLLCAEFSDKCSPLIPRIPWTCTGRTEMGQVHQRRRFSAEVLVLIEDTERLWWGTKTLFHAKRMSCCVSQELWSWSLVKELCVVWQGWTDGLTHIGSQTWPRWAEKAQGVLSLAELQQRKLWESIQRHARGEHKWAGQRCKWPEGRCGIFQTWGILVWNNSPWKILWTKLKNTTWSLPFLNRPKPSLCRHACEVLCHFCHSLWRVCTVAPLYIQGLHLWTQPTMTGNTKTFQTKRQTKILYLYFSSHFPLANIV